jgi:hypothetical protein
VRRRRRRMRRRKFVWGLSTTKTNEMTALATRERVCCSLAERECVVHWYSIEYPLHFRQNVLCFWA